MMPVGLGLSFKETRSNAPNLIVARKGVALEVYLSRLARFQQGLDFHGFRHQFVTRDFQGPSYLLSEAGDSRAAKAVFRLAQKALCIVTGDSAMRFGKVNRCISQQSSTQRNDQLAQVSIFGF
jgi:hypothetical protein